MNKNKKPMRLRDFIAIIAAMFTLPFLAYYNSLKTPSSMGEGAFLGILGMASWVLFALATIGAAVFGFVYARRKEKLGNKAMKPYRIIGIVPLLIFLAYILILLTGTLYKQVISMHPDSVRYEENKVAFCGESLSRPPTIIPANGNFKKDRGYIYWSWLSDEEADQYAEQINTLVDAYSNLVDEVNGRNICSNRMISEEELAWIIERNREYIGLKADRARIVEEIREQRRVDQ